MQVVQQARVRLKEVEGVATLEVISSEVTAQVSLDLVRQILEDKFRALHMASASKASWAYVWNNVIEDIEV